MEGMIGEVRIFAGTFAPRSWAFCQGQLMAISENSALFSVLGTTYGGDGRTTFGLPDLRGRAAVGPGTGPGLPTVRLGEKEGRETTTLLAQNLPSHHHTLNVSNTAGATSTPTNAFPALSQVQTERGGENYGVNSYGNAPNSNMNNNVLGNTGGSTPVDIRNPYLPCNYIICLYGIYPSRS